LQQPRPMLFTRPTSAKTSDMIMLKITRKHNLMSRLLTEHKPLLSLLITVPSLHSPPLEEPIHCALSQKLMLIDHHAQRDSAAVLPRNS
jgi:hypothetical protein